MDISTIGFDADDTLWHSETYFAVTEERFHALLAPWCDASEAADKLLARERANLGAFGYGVKGFTLSMIETAIEATDGAIPAAALGEIIEWGRTMLSHPVELLPGVPEVLDDLADAYRLVLITKGDLFHQESKIAESTLADRVEAVEILSEKSPESYRRVLDRLGIEPDEFCMVGNSVRSDVLPVLELGANAVHVPHDLLWGHEAVDDAGTEPTWAQLGSLCELPAFLAGLGS